MFQSTLTLLIRSLREDVRLLRSHLLRLLFLGLIYWSLYIAQEQGSWMGAPGLWFFYSIAQLNFFFITIAGVSYFATAITEEKEEMTLGLLRMAGISHVSLLLGKSTPRMLTALLLLSAQFPFTLLAITLGGVTFSQVIATYCALLAYIVFLGNLGLLFSVISRHSRPATFFTAVTLLVFFIGVFILEGALLGWTSFGSTSGKGIFIENTLVLLGHLRDASPYKRLGVILATGFAESPFSFQVLSNLIAGAVLFGLAWLAFPIFAADEKPATPGRGLLSRRIGRFRVFSTGRTWPVPFAWKDFHFIAGGKLMLIIKFILYATLGPGLVYLSQTSWGGRVDREDIGNGLMWTCLLGMAIEIALYAGRVFREERQWKTLSSVMMLPISTAEIAYSKIAGCLIGLSPAAVCFFIGMVLSPEDFFDVLQDLLEEEGFWLTLSMYAVFIHLTAFLSLTIKWGALPLAFVMSFVLPYFCMFSVAVGTSGSAADGFAILLTFVAAVIAIVLHFCVGERLRTRAAE